MDNFIEKFVCNVGDLPDNQKKVYEIEDGLKLLLINENGKYYATGTKCSHFSAPLVNGIVYKGHIKCPWHGAEFNLATGDIEDFPGFGCLPVYEVQQRGDQIWIKANQNVLKNNKANLIKCVRDNNDNRTFIIIGGGAAGFQCAETLRDKGYRGKLILITAENALPYDRTKLSKILDSKIENILLRDEEFYKSASIDVFTGKKVTRLDHKENRITCQDGQQFNYDKIFLSTGVFPRRYYLPGSDLKNIFYLRNNIDANKIIEAAVNKDVVVVGSSFIGMEVAANLVGKAKSVSVVGRSNVPFKTLFSGEIGAKIKEFYESKGVVFHLKCQVKKFLGSSGAVEEVVITGRTLKADVVVLGIGAEADVSYLENSGILFHFYNNVVVNKKMETSIPNIYAGGDMVAFPLSTYDDKLINIGHWQISQKQGRTAALNMLGIETELHTVPFFYSMMFGKGLRMAGYTDKIDDVFIHGSLDITDLKFAAYHFKNDKVVSLVTMGFDPLASYFAALLKDGKVLNKNDIKADPIGWAKDVLY